MSERSGRTLVYGTPIENSLVFIERSKAQTLSQIWRAIDTATTWNEFRARMPASEYEAIMSATFDEDEEPRPAEDDDFDYELISCDDEWPSNPWDDMEELLPDSVCELAEPVRYREFFNINAKYEERAVALLRASGWQVERDDDLVRKACGHWNLSHIWNE